jgi:soluble lytic murein transglycosylase-like protein
MRKRVLLFAAPLLVVAIATSVAVAAPSSAEHSRGPKLDKLHAERPIAASESSNADLSVTDAGFQKAATDIQNYLHYAQQVDDYLRALGAQAVGDYIVSLQVAETAQAAAPQRVSSAVSYSSDPGDFLSCVRNRESGGNYGVYNSGGSGAAGAYQFMPGTWNSIAASSGRGDLVGLDPAQAAPSDQDAMAQALYSQQGAAPWGGGC